MSLSHKICLHYTCNAVVQSAQFSKWCIPGPGVVWFERVSRVRRSLTVTDIGGLEIPVSVKTGAAAHRVGSRDQRPAS